jgi:hypothetical protein
MIQLRVGRSSRLAAWRYDQIVPSGNITAICANRLTYAAAQAVSHHRCSKSAADREPEADGFGAISHEVQGKNIRRAAGSGSVDEAVIRLSR